MVTSPELVGVLSAVEKRRSLTINSLINGFGRSSTWFTERHKTLQLHGRRRLTYKRPTGSNRIDLRPTFFYYYVTYSVYKNRLDDTVPHTDSMCRFLPMTRRPQSNNNSNNNNNSSSKQQDNKCSRQIYIKNIYRWSRLQHPPTLPWNFPNPWTSVTQRKRT